MIVVPQAQEPAGTTEDLRTLLQNAYERLRKNELVVFCSLRLLCTTGSPSQLAKRLADHDISTYRTPSTFSISSSPLLLQSILQCDQSRQDPQRTKQPMLTESPFAHHLPLELVAQIVDHIGDWELSKAVGLPTSLKTPLAWSWATRLDLAILSLNLAQVKRTPGPFYMVSAKAAIRFSAVDIIDHLYSRHRHCFDKTLGNILPANASLEGSIPVLNWWKTHRAHVNPYDHSALDGASLNGHVHVLEWWANSDLPLKYSEAALENASARAHLAVLNWWKDSGQPLKIGRVMELASGMGHINVLEWWHRSGLDFKYDKIPLYHASVSGRVDSLNWWAQSGLQMLYDSDALVGATKHNKPESLEWWDKSDFPIQYRPCDIEEALEDASQGGTLVRAWWEKKGVDFGGNYTEWTKFQSLH